MQKSILSLKISLSIFVVEESIILKKCTKPFHFFFDCDRATTEKPQGVLF